MPGSRASAGCGARGWGPGAMNNADDPHEIPIDCNLDLHTFRPRDIPSVVEEYVNAAHAAELREVRLVHGRGKGIQRGSVEAAPARHPLVIAVYDAADAALG